MLPALDAIPVHRSAHSFAAGPITAEPFILPLRFTMCSVAQSCQTICDHMNCSPPSSSVRAQTEYWSGLPFPPPGIVYCDPCIIFRIKKHTIFSPIWVSLSNYHHWMYVLSQLWFAFLDCGHHYVTHTSSRKSLQSFVDCLHRDYIQISGSCVVSTVDHGSKGKTQGNLEFRTLRQHLECQKGTKVNNSCTECILVVWSSCLFLFSLLWQFHPDSWLRTPSFCQ